MPATLHVGASLILSASAPSHTAATLTQLALALIQGQPALILDAAWSSLMQPTDDQFTRRHLQFAPCLLQERAGQI